MSDLALKCSVLIPSFGRPASLRRCLDMLGRQSRRAEEIIVAWQEDDTPTRNVVESMAPSIPELRLVHIAVRGVVPAENAALATSTGQIILLIDDDAIAPPDWIERHLRFYTDDATIGAVGGPADNFNPDGTPFPRRTNEPIGRLHYSGRLDGNMYDQPREWRTERSPREVDHLVGYNMSFLCAALDRFDETFRPYWQLFELDACLAIREAGYRVIFDFANVVEHHPTNAAFVGGRDGNLVVKAINPSFNHALVLSKHTRARAQRAVRLLYLFLIGSVATPGVVASLIAVRRYGGVAREWRLLRACLDAKCAGWRAGAARRFAKSK